MHFFSADFSDWTEHISFITRVTWGILAFGLFTLGVFGGPEKDRVFGFCWESFHSLEVDGYGVLCSSGEAARDPIGVLPSASSFFLAFSILLHCVSSLLMAAPHWRSINLEVEILNFTATS